MHRTFGLPGYVGPLILALTPTLVRSSVSLTIR